jgi:transposase-like protein
MVPKPAIRRRHTAAFKWESVQVMHRRLAAGVSLRASDELEIGVGLLRRWAQAVAGAPAGANVEEIFPGSGHTRTLPDARCRRRPSLESMEVELRRLRRENKRLRLERDFLKKRSLFSY